MKLPHVDLAPSLTAITNLINSTIRVAMLYQYKVSLTNTLNLCFKVNKCELNAKNEHVLVMNSTNTARMSGHC